MGYLDIAWKEGLEDYLEQAVALLFPDAHSQIDWSRGYEFLDKELQQIVPEGETGTRLVDKLAKIWLKNGEEKWVLLHVDVQGEAQEHFGQRMYVYNYRIFDRYGRQVATLAILADDQPGWRPDGFGYNLLGCNIDFRFPIAKLLDFSGKEADLEASSNVFAIVVLAFLQSRRTADDANQRRVFKVQLIRSLFDRGLGRRDVQKLFRLIHWFMALPADMERQVWREVAAIEQEKQMKNMTVLEEIWFQDGQAKGEAEGEARGRAEAEARSRAKLEAATEAMLRLKFGPATAATLAPEIRSLTAEQLDDAFRLIEAAASLDEVRQAWSKEH